MTAASRPDALSAVPRRHPGVSRDPVTLLVALTAGNSAKQRRWVPACAGVTVLFL